jgi:hypothetical protein
MGRVLYFDCFSGISGDMALGALCDVGLDTAALHAVLARLQVPGWSIQARRETRGWLTGTRMEVVAPEQDTHRHLHDVVAIIQAAQLSPRVTQQAIAVFTMLAEAEAEVHGVAASEVHFHEVGALDAIVDIVGVVAGLELLGVDRVYASPLPLGSGWVKAAHGDIPVPAPATLNLLSRVHAPIIPDQATFELVTPTGAALLATLAEFRRPAMQLQRVGYGFGKKVTARPNALRAWLGVSDAAAESLVLLECNIDDQTPEQLAYACERLMTDGARDVWMQPISMKKGRAATLLAVLCDDAHEALLVDRLMRETTTLGMRRQRVDRHVAERHMIEVTTPYGVIRVKQKIWQGVLLAQAPEYEDCATSARQHAVSIQQVYQSVYDSLTQ